MQNPPNTVADVCIEILNDDETPYMYVVETLKSVFGRVEADAQELARAVHRSGRCQLGPFDPVVASTLVERASGKARLSGHPLSLRVLDPDIVHTEQRCCSFCNKSNDDCRLIYAGVAAFICDQCLLSGARSLSAANPDKPLRHVPDLLDWHFGGLGEADLVTVQRTFPARMRADLQAGLDEHLGGTDARVVGIHGARSYEGIDFAELFGERHHPKSLGPLQYEEVDIGEERGRRCLVNALWLLHEGECALAVLLVQRQTHGGSGLMIEIAAPAGADAQGFADQLFRRLETAVAEARSYRGKVLSLEVGDHYQGMSTGIRVHALAPVRREDVVLPASTLALIDRNIIAFARQRARLKALGQSIKKGLLFYGPPGTGKTHTVRYLSGCLPDHTTLLVTAGQVGYIGEYFQLARLLQPAILVIEDADLIARDRASMGGPCEEALLNRLLNEMDGMTAEAELFVVLTTNRPDAIEAALAQRPGRIDQAVEFPPPDLDNRIKLINLYRGRLEVEPQVVEELAGRAEGVSAAFIKELMRRIAQSVVEREQGDRVVLDDVETALSDMLLGRRSLDGVLLGAAEETV